MTYRNRTRLAGRGFFLFFSCALTAGLNAQVTRRIVQPVDEHSLVRLAGSVHPLARVAADLGRAPADLPMMRVLLHLTASAEQEAELAALLEAQQNPDSAEYQLWLSPQQFGERFGLAQQDLDAITAWLTGQGLQVTAIAANRRSIEFGGSARQMEQAFHTDPHFTGGRRTAHCQYHRPLHSAGARAGGRRDSLAERLSTAPAASRTGAPDAARKPRAGDRPLRRRAFPFALRFRRDLRCRVALEQQLRRHGTDHRDRRADQSQADGCGGVPLRVWAAGQGAASDRQRLRPGNYQLGRGDRGRPGRGMVGSGGQGGQRGLRGQRQHQRHRRYRSVEFLPGEQQHCQRDQRQLWILRGVHGSGRQRFLQQPVAAGRGAGDIGIRGCRRQRIGGLRRAADFERQPEYHPAGQPGLRRQRAVLHAVQRGGGRLGIQRRQRRHVLEQLQRYAPGIGQRLHS